MPTPICPISDRLELFVDHYLLDSLTNTRLKLHEPREADVAVRFDSPWEGRFSGCLVMVKDGDLYRMYFRGMPEAGTDGTNVECTCIAESRDGIHWIKPAVGLFDYGPHSRTGNNIVIHNQPPASHNFAPFLDTRPGVPASERYKAVAGLHESGVFVYASPDGLNWKRLQEGPVMTSKPFAFDSVNYAFWSTHENCYVFYYRTFKGLPDWRNAVRWVSRRTSADFINWSEGEEMEANNPALDQIYTQGTHPYFRAPHIYISLAARFMPGKKVITDAEAKAIGVNEAYYGDCSDAVLMTSRGGNKYDRTFMESFIRPGLGAQNWISRTNYPAIGVVPTGPTEMSLYAHRQYAQTTSYAGRFTLRTDGFASINAPYAGGEAVTKPLTFKGSELVLNYATSAAGEIRVEVQDENRNPIPGYALNEAVTILGDKIEGVASWKNGPSVASLAGKTVRLRFVMRDADLYSLRFR